MNWLTAVFRSLLFKLQKNKQNVKSPLDLFHGPFQPCQVFESSSTGRVVARTIFTDREIIFPAHYFDWDVKDWLFYHGCSIGFVSFDATIKLTNDF